jgi:hypothetical protein
MGTPKNTIRRDNSTVDFRGKPCHATVPVLQEMTRQGLASALVRHVELILRMPLLLAWAGGVENAELAAMRPDGNLLLNQPDMKLQNDSVPGTIGGVGASLATTALPRVFAVGLAGSTRMGTP